MSRDISCRGIRLSVGLRGVRNPLCMMKGCNEGGKAGRISFR